MFERNSLAKRGLPSAPDTTGAITCFGPLVEER